MFQYFVISSLLAGCASASLGDGLWRTFVHQTKLPLTSEDAENQGWVPVSSCDSDLGILYAQDKSGPSEKHPLGLRFTSGGQVAGVQTTVFGSNKQGNAAPQHLVDLGYWRATNATETWSIDVSFRDSALMCDGSTSADLTGDRVVINQDTLKQSIPLSAKQAQSEKWTAGSCMASMGWHHFYDVSSAPEISYELDQLLPVVPMYNPPDETGKLNAFFFASPVSQPGSSLKYAMHGAADWEVPALPSSLMCQNFCDDDNCKFDSSYATMHIYLSSEWEDLKCPSGSGPVGRSCDL